MPVLRTGGRVDLGHAAVADYDGGAASPPACSARIVDDAALQKRILVDNPTRLYWK